MVRRRGADDDADVPTTLDFDHGLARQVDAVNATPDVTAARIIAVRGDLTCALHVLCDARPLGAALTGLHRARFVCVARAVA